MVTKSSDLLMQTVQRKYVLLLVLVLLVVSASAVTAHRKKTHPRGTKTAAAQLTPPQSQQGVPLADIPCQEPTRRQKPQFNPQPAKNPKVLTVGGGPGDPITPAITNYLTLTNVKLVRVADDAGRAEYALNERQTGQRLEHVVYEPSGKNSLLIMTSADKTYTITFQPVEGTTIALDLVRGENNEFPDLAVRYNDLLLPANSTALLEVNAQGIEPLRVDEDGDGVFETVIRPPYAVTGQAANDIGGPRICFGRTERDGRDTITIAAADPSGVEAIYYSLDTPLNDGLLGTSEEVTAQRYDGPFTVDPARVPVIAAFADDKVGNRSGIYKFRLTTGP